MAHVITLAIILNRPLIRTVIYIWISPFVLVPKDGWTASSSGLVSITGKFANLIAVKYCGSENCDVINRLTVGTIKTLTCRWATGTMLSGGDKRKGRFSSALTAAHSEKTHFETICAALCIFGTRHIIGTCCFFYPSPQKVHWSYFVGRGRTSMPGIGPKWMKCLPVCPTKPSNTIGQSRSYRSKLNSGCLLAGLSVLLNNAYDWWVFLNTIQISFGTCAST